jgi:hypothetical protein
MDHQQGEHHHHASRPARRLWSAHRRHDARCRPRAVCFARAVRASERTSPAYRCLPSLWPRALLSHGTRSSASLTDRQVAVSRETPWPGTLCCKAVVAGVAGVVTPRAGRGGSASAVVDGHAVWPSWPVPSYAAARALYTIAPMSGPQLMSLRRLGTKTFRRAGRGEASPRATPVSMLCTPDGGAGHPGPGLPRLRLVGAKLPHSRRFRNAAPLFPVSYGRLRLDSNAGPWDHATAARGCGPRSLRRWRSEPARGRSSGPRPTLAHARRIVLSSRWPARVEAGRPTGRGVRSRSP